MGSEMCIRDRGRPTSTRFLPSCQCHGCWRLVFRSGWCIATASARSSPQHHLGFSRNVGRSSFSTGCSLLPGVLCTSGPVLLAGWPIHRSSTNRASCNSLPRSRRSHAAGGILVIDSRAHCISLVHGNVPSVCRPWHLRTDSSLVWGPVSQIAWTCGTDRKIAARRENAREWCGGETQQPASNLLVSGR